MHLRNFAGNSPERHGFFHSHGYTSSGHRHSIGATTSETFSERRTLDSTRQVVNRYNGMAHIYDAPRTREIAPNRTTGLRTTSSVVIPPRSTGFREPPTRYNPYS